MGQIGTPKEVVEVEPAQVPYKGKEIKSPERKEEKVPVKQR